jgi:hypothetical protein
MEFELVGRTSVDVADWDQQLRDKDAELAAKAKRQLSDLLNPSEIEQLLRYLVSTRYRTSGSTVVRSR